MVMFDSGDGHFVGAMPPSLFLERFMPYKEASGPPPIANFSQITTADTIEAMRGSFINAVEASGVCPDIKLYKAKTTRRRENEENFDKFYQPASDYDSSDNRIELPTASIRHSACPAIAVCKKARAQRRAKKAGSGSAAKTKKPGDDVSYYDYASNLLDIEVIHDINADPFEDPPEAPPSPSSSAHASPVGGIKSRRLPASDHSIAPPAVQPIDQTSVLPLSPSPDNENHPGQSSACLQPVSTPAERRVQNPPRSSRSPSIHYESFERNTAEARVFRMRIISHVKAEFARQQRLFLFQVILIGHFARFILWDRSGAVVSELFDYLEDSALLSRFLWRFNHMTDEQRGLDPSASIASLKEKAQFEDAVKAFVQDMQRGTKDGSPVRALPGAERTLDDTKTYPTWKIRVVDCAKRCSTDLIVRRPFSEHSSLWGRDTRAYLAYDVATHRLVCLKDTWRTDNPKLRVESRTYRDLSRHNVPHIPVVLYGADVRGTDRQLQRTRSQEYAEEEDEWRVTLGKLQRYVHHRLVQEVAFPLQSAIDAKEFIQVLHDVLCAVGAAYENAGLLHRDVSYGNVMITSEGRGILNDWDHAGSRDELAPGIGTWSYMSIGLLEDPHKLHDLIDDLESAFWVLVYGALKHYLAPGQPTVQVLMNMFDEERVNEDNNVVGGQRKANCLWAGRLQHSKFTSTGLEELVRDCSMWWGLYHRAVDGARDIELEATKVKILSTLDLAPRPSYWIEKYAKVLTLFTAAAQNEPAHTSQSGTSVAKRLAPDGGLPDRHDETIVGLRRSKRLKVVHGQS